MKTNFRGRNPFWYSFGAASSVVAAAGIDTYLNPTIGRGPMGFDMYFLLWLAYFVFAWFGYVICHSALNLIKRNEGKNCSHLFPLLIGVSYAPMLLSLAKVIPEGGVAWILPVAVPPFIAAIAMRFVPEKKPEPEPAGAGQPDNPPVKL